MSFFSLVTLSLRKRKMHEGISGSVCQEVATCSATILGKACEMAAELIYSKRSQRTTSHTCKG